ncbi:MAG: stalk domain-containing protein [Bacillota bacterium]|nr:stalk domain-containing protein [Bacillota bacterium]
MKKIIILTLCALMLISPVGVLAENFTTVTFEVQLGSYVAMINGEAKPAEAPFLSEGSMMVPLDVVADAFGAEYTENEKITYNDIEIIFTEGNKFAKVDGTEKEMSAAPVKVNDSLMVPIRFICDTFNALIEYDDATQTVKVTKSADFSGILDKNGNGYWYDSHYGWMIRLPEEYSLYQQVYDGSLTRFMNEAGDAAYTMYVEKNEYQNIDQARMKILALNAGDVLREEKIINIDNDVKAFYAEYEDCCLIVAIKGDYVFDMEFNAESAQKFDSYKEEAIASLNSLTFNIDESLKPEDVSILNEGGYNVTTDNTIGITVNRLESWTKPDSVATNSIEWHSGSYKLINVLDSDEFYYGSMNVSVYTALAEDTPEKLIESRVHAIENSYNKSFLSGVKTYEVSSEENKGMQVEYTILYNGKKQVCKTKYFILNGYIYEAQYTVVYSAITDEAKLKLDEVEKMFDSIKCSGPNEDKIGKVLNISDLVSNGVTQTYKNEKNKFSIEIPAAWSVTADSVSLSAQNAKQTMGVESYIVNKISTLGEAKSTFYDSQIENLKSLGTYVSSQCSKDMFAGKQAYKISIVSLDDKGDKEFINAYTFINDKEAYYIAFNIKEVYSSDSNKTLLKAIEKSFKLL